MAYLQEMNARVYLSGHTGSFDIVLPWRASEDGEIPDWPLYERFLNEAENASEMTYREPSGAGESISWGYGVRSALSLIIEVNTDQWEQALPLIAKMVKEAKG